MSFFRSLFGGSTKETGVHAVAVAQLPSEVTTSAEAETVKKVRPESFLNRITVNNHTDALFPYVEVLSVTDDSERTILKGDVHSGDSYFSATRSREPYRLRVLASKTSDCSVAIHATDPFLIEGAYRNEMAKKVWAYHENVQEIPGVAELTDQLVRIGKYTLPETLPSPLLEELKTLEEDCATYATDESVTKFQQAHRMEIIEKKDTLHLLTKEIDETGRTVIDLYADRMEVAFNGNKQVIKL